MKWLTYILLLILFLGIESCKKCDGDGQGPVSCVSNESAEIDFLKIMSGSSIDLMDTMNHIVSIEFDQLNRHEDQDDFCDYEFDCECKCKNNALLKGKLSGLYSNVKFELGLTYTTTNLSCEVEKRFTVLVGKESITSSKTPFYKHNQATLYKTLKFGNRDYVNVYRVPITTQKSTNTNLVFQIGDIYLTEAEGIIGLNNQLDSLIFFKVL